MQNGHPTERPPPRIDSNMPAALVSFVLFWPLAIPAVINANRVKPLLRAGDYAGAQQAAAESRRWSKLAVIIGIVAWLAGIGCCLGLLTLVKP